MADALLTVRGLVKRFGAVLASDALDLTVMPGEIHAVIGPNGAGKTTLLGQLAGGVRPDRGTITWQGRDITSLPEHQRVALGLARSFQMTSIFPRFSVVDNVVLAVQARGGHSFRFWRPVRTITPLYEQARGVLQQVGLAARADTLAANLSHGEQRQLDLAMALATQPRLLLLDEPSAGMGADESAQMTALLRTLRGELTILLVEHDMDVVFALADCITVLVYGRAIATGTASVIRSNSAVRQAYLGEDDEDIARALR